MKEEDGMRFIEERALSACKTCLQEDGTLVSEVAEARTLDRRWKVYR